MIKKRIYYLVYLVPLIISVFVFLNFEKGKNLSKKQFELNLDNYKYEKGEILTSLLSELETPDETEYLLEINTCIPNDKEGNCIFIVAEQVHFGEQSCEKEQLKILKELSDLIVDGIKLDYQCKPIIDDIYAKLSL